MRVVSEWPGGLWRAVVAGGLFPLHERLKGHDTITVRRRLERSQWLTAEEIARERLERLRAYLVRAGNRVPYYRRIFAEVGFEPARMRAESELAVLPLLDKKTIREHAREMRAEDAAGLKPFNTGGSSGEPLTFYLSRERVSHDVAAKWRATRWWGVDIGDPEIVLWGSPIEIGTQDRIKQLRDRLFRTRLLPAFAMSDANMDAYLRRIARGRPKMLFGYPSALALLANRARATGLAGVRVPERVSFCTGERLYPEQREVIASVFGGRVANGYGGRDAGFIAHECPAGRLHISAEDIAVEVVDPEGRPVTSGTPGEIVITHTATGDFPFIRYRTGDIAAVDDAPCACGRGLPALTDLQGRSTDFVVASDGTRMHGLALIYVMREQPGVSAFKIEQHDLHHTSVLVVSDGHEAVDMRTSVERRFRERLGADVTVDVREVNDIPPERSGKYRYVVSHVNASS